jgi:hypothetical protein
MLRGRDIFWADVVRKTTVSCPRTRLLPQPDGFEVVRVCAWTRDHLLRSPGRDRGGVAGWGRAQGRESTRRCARLTKQTFYPSSFSPLSLGEGTDVTCGLVLRSQARMRPG